jgi:GT2 family glycosyltransferase
MDERAQWALDAEKALCAAPRNIVAIPVCNERDHIAACLDALASQVGLDRGELGIILFLNNCTDGTADIVRDYVGMPWPMRVIERDDPQASAGWARRIAMEAAARWVAEGGHDEGVLLTTDADSRVGLDWVAANVAVLDAGADAVAGRIALDPADAAKLPGCLHARGRLEAAYEALLIEIDARLDPELGDPWPCHWSKSGATIGVKWSVYRQVGGMPDRPSGEDRAFIDAVRAHDYTVRHAPHIEVITSGRLDGRAAGGVADTMKLRCDEPETPCDVRLEPLARIVAKALIRRRLRVLVAEGRLVDSSWMLRALQLPKDARQRLVSVGRIGTALSIVTTQSPRFACRPLRPSQLTGHIRLARLLLTLLRLIKPSVPLDASNHAGAVARSPTRAIASSPVDVVRLIRGPKDNVWPRPIIVPAAAGDRHLSLLGDEPSASIQDGRNG